MTKNLLFLFFKTTKQKLHSQEPETPQKKLAEIGTQLREYREQQSISLDKVAVVTMIRRNLLQAIEDGQLDQLPEPIYTQGLIKRYAEAMGLDATKFADFFPPIEPPARSRTKISWQHLPQLRPMHLYLFYTFLIICSVNGLSQLMGSSVTAKNGAGTQELALDRQKQDSLTASASSTSKNQKPDGHVAVKAAINGQKSDKSSNKPVMVSLTFKAESWMQIEVDGKTEFEGILPIGTVRTWEADRKLVVVAGNAGGVMIAVNNGQPELIGAPGVPKELVFKADELKPAAEVKNQG
ncbi:helix-turn-helix domain-containing protein [Microcoleus sp. LEGE 07076]|uniref:helix-turn-helix domain-containing protein n=1 Tax=Microcoleus sp. LEGE 07076 TaxID=915322 RepID=UPI001882F5EE|nr:RodZ domain-containing protein [Microcoleus sp. LEGE 07076]MBE9184620.1 helix-turn-helix domain-containing protein [Microcoleus sp. LEGE 07076]